MKNKIQNLIKNLNDQIIGKEDIIKIALASLFAGGHILIEDRPGVGKTTLSRLLAKASGLDFKRVQFTSDLLPTDILGFLYLEQSSRDFVFKKGPIFTDILLADEINRSSTRTQSAFLQAMEEREVSIEGEHFKLSENFCVIATQNHLDHAGTNELPISQLDRFAISLSFGPSSRSQEMEVLKKFTHHKASISEILNRDELAMIKKNVENIGVSDKAYHYILDILDCVRNHFGQVISIRAAQELVKISKSYSLIEEKDFVTPEIIRLLSPYVISHRLSGQSSIESVHHRISELIKEVKVEV